jgi:heme a synthase
VRTLRRYAYAVFGVACAHLVFGAIVRISGSGMGCGDHWPKCYGYWFPPMSRPDLIIEVSHRYLASILLLGLIALLVAAWRRRAEPEVGGRGGVLRMAALAVGLGFGAAILGAVTVKLGNAPLATVAHWTVAMSLVAAVAATVIRAGGLGGASARRGGVTRSVKRAAFAAATLALIAVVMGGLTAKVPGGAVACLDFPLCGANPSVAGGAVHVQLTHRIIAFLLILHLFGMLMAQRKRQSSPVVKRAVLIAFSLGVLQLLVAGAMIGMRLPPVLRSLHEATGVSIWIAAFVLAYLARIASGDAAVPAVLHHPVTPLADGNEEPVPVLAAQVKGWFPASVAVIVARGADI